MTTLTPAQERDALQREAEQILEENIRPQLKKHGGDVVISGLDEQVLSVRLLGQCTRCASAALTFDQMIRKTMLSSLPALRDVVLDDSVPEDMLDFAKKILRHQL